MGKNMYVLLNTDQLGSLRKCGRVKVESVPALWLSSEVRNKAWLHLSHIKSHIKRPANTDVRTFVF